MSTLGEKKRNDSRRSEPATIFLRNGGDERLISAARSGIMTAFRKRVRRTLEEPT